MTDIRDQWPDELRDLAPKFLRPLAQFILRGAYQKMEWVCKNVDGIMGISEGDIQYGLHFANRNFNKNDLMFPLGYSEKPVEEAKVQSALRWCEELGLRNDHTILCFFGTIGQYFDLKTVIEAAKILTQHYKIQFVLAGDGSHRKKFMKMAHNVPSVFFPGWLDSPKIAAVMRISKIGIAPYRVGAKMSLPNKPFEYMAGGLALISSIQGQLSRVLEENQCGLTYRADSVDDLLQNIRRLIENPSECEEMGQKARKLLEEKFALEKVFSQVNIHFNKVVNDYHKSP